MGLLYFGWLKTKILLLYGPQNIKLIKHNSLVENVWLILPYMYSKLSIRFFDLTKKNLFGQFNQQYILQS